MNAVKQVTDKAVTQDHALSLRAGMSEETGLLNDSVQLAKHAASGIMSGSLKSGEGNVLLGAGRLLSQVAKQSISNRLGRGRLLTQEAQTIEEKEGEHAAA